MLKKIESDLDALITYIKSIDERPSVYDDLAEKLNTLIKDDFNSFVQLMYRLDIDEMRLRSLLKINSGKDAAEIASGLIIERQLQKIKARQQFRKPEDGINEEDKW